MPSRRLPAAFVCPQLPVLRRLPLALLLCAAACSKDGEGGTRDWTQLGGSALHQGAVPVEAQRPARILGELVYDPFAMQEADPVFADGALRIHYQSPLVVGDDVYMERKSGTYTPCDVEMGCTTEGQVWNESHYKWVDGKLVHQWDYASDIRLTDNSSSEQIFHAAVHGDVLYVPGARGTLHKVDRHSGKLMALIDPLDAQLDGRFMGTPAIDETGNVFYSVVSNDPDTFETAYWLVKVSPSGEVRKVDYAGLVPGAPAPDALCYTAFPRGTPLPLPPPPNADGSPALPPQSPCGPQRPTYNSTPAIADDGTLYTVTRASRNARYGYLVALNADLTPKWARSLRDLFADGCGVLAQCRAGATPGVDPSTNQLPAGQVQDSSTSAPVVLPDGDVLYGTWSGYNGSRGHLVKFSKDDGKVLGSYGFGWDITPAVWSHDDTYSIILKDNRYAAEPQDEEFLITQLSADLEVEWQFRATNDQVCERGDDGKVTCQTVPGNGQEWCINAPAVDRNGTVHVASEDGNLYQIGQDGKELGRSFMQKAMRSSYTPVVLDSEGRIYAMNAGHLFVFGK